MADHVVVMRDGAIEQQGAPLELYDRPANRFVAGFIGSPAMNFVRGTVSQDGHSVALALPGAPELPFGRALEPGRPVTVGLRPEHLQVDPSSAQFDVAIRVVESTGSLAYYTTETDPELMLVEQGRGRLRAGETAGLSIAPGDIHLFDTDTSLSI